MSGADKRGYELEVLPALHSICRLDPDREIPEWATLVEGALLSIARTRSELSIICADHLPPAGTERSRGWRALGIAEELDHSLVGVLVSLAAPLADAEIPIFAISSFDTDYMLIPGRSLAAAEDALRAQGHTIAGGSPAA